MYLYIDGITQQQTTTINNTYRQHAGRIEHFTKDTMFAIQKVGRAGRDEKLTTCRKTTAL
jgi:hypothetical protein